ncbi:hypothetical protein [Salinilacihabitans rarus]|uniref:hypothetical protein n=1 Tax=Salinilacihabitans rarus TaxID=2961596 RepID=UPI0020C87BDA|nr:hypothetical protein [Salinilacihabitans rarus]
MESDRILWRYPRREGDKKGIGYAAVGIDHVARRDTQPPAIHFTCNSTVGRIAAGEPYSGYRPDWFRFRIWPPTAYEGRLQYHLRVEPPGQWEDFSAYYDIRDQVRRSTVELRNVDTQGTIMIPAVFDPGMKPLPEYLNCAFTVQASRPGLLGKTVRVADRDTLELGSSSERDAPTGPDA